MEKNNKYTTSYLLKEIKKKSSVSKTLIIKVLQNVTSDISNADELSNQMSKIINCSSIVKQSAQPRVAFTIFEFCVLNNHTLTKDQLRYLVSMFESSNVYMSNTIRTTSYSIESLKKIEKLREKFLTVYDVDMAYRRFERFKSSEIAGFGSISYAKSNVIEFLLECLLENDNNFGESVLNKVMDSANNKTLKGKAIAINSFLNFCTDRVESVRSYGKKLADRFVEDNYGALVSEILDVLHGISHGCMNSVLNELDYWSDYDDHDHYALNDLLYEYYDYSTIQTTNIYLAIIKRSSYEVKWKNIELEISKSKKEDS